MSASDIISFYRDLELLEIPSAGFPKDMRWKWTREVHASDEVFPIQACDDIIGTDIPYYRVFIGCPKQADLVRTVARAICGPDGVDAFVEEQIGGNRGALATLTLDWAGRLVKGSFRVAPFVFACARLAEGKDLSGVQDEIKSFESQASKYLGSEYDSRQKDLSVWRSIHEQLSEEEKAAVEAGDVKEFTRIEKLRGELEVQEIDVSENPVHLSLLHKVTRRLAGIIGMSGSLPILVTEASRKWRKNSVFPYPPGSENFMSFYFKELDRILSVIPSEADPNTALGSFLLHGREVQDRIEIMRSDEDLSGRLSAGSYAPARWPSNPSHALSLAQQIGVQDALDEKSPVSAINGPPGTGKTTLLRDVIANKVVARAMRLAELKKPGDAFKVCQGIATVATGLVEGTEIVVASNGNRAVENITLEIPRKSEIDEVAFPSASYFPEAAEAVAMAFERPSEAWGLIALAMGKKGNISRTMSALRNGARSSDRKQSRIGLIGALESRGKIKRGEWKKSVTLFLDDLKAFSTIMQRRSLGDDDSDYAGLEEILALKGDPSRHASTVWSDADLDELRSRIFLRALKLHEIVLRSKPDALNQFLQEFEAVLLDEMEVEPEREVLLWRTFFLITPVISTTFASMRRLPRAGGWIGCLMIDEAGQATPQSAVPALYRAKKAVIVGDPAQLKPICTVPDAVIEALRTRRSVSKDLSPTTESVQSIADATMQIGGYLRDPAMPQQRLWAGIPLRVHRRCAQPMFDVINKISYDGQMVSSGDLKAAAQKLTTPFRYSQWFDVRSHAGSGHVVKAEMDCLEDILRSYRDAGVLGSGRTTSAMVVTPFSRVQSSARLVIKRVFGKNYHDIEAGTIHRFQGREADIVILVLGSAPGWRGARSREWAARDPSLLNVAVSRARTKLFVIGNHHDWSQMEYFSIMSEAFQGPSFNLIQPYRRQTKAPDDLLNLL
jgi:hypothetical protein